MMDSYYKVEETEIENLLFTQENVDHFKLYQKSIELVGVLEKPELKNNLIKFLLTNNSGIIIQVNIWDETKRENMNSFMIPGNIIHFDGLCVTVKNLYSKGNINYFDLVVSTNTQYHLLKSAPTSQPESTVTNSLVVTDIENCLKYPGRIKISAWLKQKICNKGCLSDCLKYKLELRMSTPCDMSHLEVGSHVEVTGFIKYASQPYILVQRKEDIVLASQDKKTIKEYLKGASIPKRPLGEQNNNSSAKKMFVG